MNSVYFDYPYLLLLFPILLVCFKLCPQKDNALLFSNTKLLSKSKKKISLIDIFKVLTIFFITISLASPYTLSTYTKIKKNPTSISLVIDISGSMIDKYPPLVKTIKSFVSKRKGDIFSLIYFADSVAIASAPTYDINFIKKSLDFVKVGNLQNMDTHLYDAIYLANSMLKQKDINNSIMIVVTDGIDKGSKTTFQKLSNQIYNKKTAIYTIGYADDTDKDILKAISKQSGGVFIDINTTKNIDKPFKKIDKLYSNNEENKDYTHKKPLYQIPLFFGFLSLLFYTYLLNKRAVL